MSISAHAQLNSLYTVPPLSPNNGAGGVTFELESSLPIELQGIHCAFTTGATTATVWMRTGGVQHSPGLIDISTANGWSQVIIGATITGADNTTIISIPMGTTVIPLNPNVRYGFHIEGNTRYQTGLVTDPLFVTDGVLSIHVQDAASYGGPPPIPPNNPRRFTGGVTYQVALSGAANDAGVIAVNLPAPPLSPGLHPVTANIRNFGTNPITSVNVNWTVNNVAQTPIPWTGLLDTTGGTGSNTALVALGNYNFPQGNATIKAWTSSPNGLLDTFNINDTSSISYHFASPLSGIYTIGGTSADYATIDAAVSALNSFGVTGPVTFHVTPNSGPYVGGFEFGNILGVNATNTITFKGNMNVINESTPSYIVGFNGSQYITIDSFNIAVSSSSINKFGVLIRGGSQYLTFTNNVINMGITGTGTAHAGIVASNSLTSATTTGNNGKYLTISNNKIIGGYYGIILMGAASYQNCFGNVITNNVVEDFYLYGIYLSNNDTTLVKGNDISRPTRTSISTLYGIYATTTRNTKYVENKIHTSGSGSYSAYPIYLTVSANSLGYETEVINNAIYNIQSSSITYGIYVLGTNSFINFYYNTINLTPPSGTSAVRGFFFSTAPNNYRLFNNNVSITGAATGTKFGIYVTTTATTMLSDNNNFYLSSGGTANHTGYWTANRTLLSDWQTATSQDFNSVSANPQFTAVNDWHAGAIALFQTGTPIAGVTTDLEGDPRHPTNPCIGADEYILYSNDASIIVMSAPVAPCPGISDVKVRIKNSGIQSFTGATIHWSVNGVTQAPFSYTGTLAPGADQEVTLGSFNFVSGLLYNLTFNSSNPGGLADQNPANDTLQVVGLQTALSGVFTVGSAPTDNFPTMAAAVQALKSNGICGPVTINVVANSGPYAGGLDFEGINGSSSVNTITLNGNGNIINETSLGYIMRFSGNSFITIDNFQLIVSNPANARFGILMRNGCANINITNNVINLGTTSTSTASAGIVASGSETSATTAGNNARYLTITNNTIIGGYYGITLMGNSSYLDNFGHSINNNVLNDFYLYGIYLANADTSSVANNNISRATRSTISTFYGIYGTTVRNIKVRNNRVHSSGAGSYTAYPIWFATTSNTIGYESEFVNNAIYNIPSTGTIYGIYASGTINYLNIYHNTVHLNPQSGSGAVRGVFLAVAPNNSKLFNNIISIEGAGTGAKYGVYVTTTSTSFSSNNNVFYLNAVGTTNYIGYWSSTNQTTLADWQLASSQDAMSLTVNPVLASPVSGNVMPLSSGIDNMGTPVGVATDLSNAPRSPVTPDVGALEFTGIASDLALVSGQIVNGQCLSTNDSVYITFANVIGSAVNFATATTTVYWSVTGPVNSSGSIVVNSGTLAPAASLTVGGAGVNLSLPGAYSLNAYLGANSFNLFSGNDTLNNLASKQIYNPFYVEPKTIMVNNSTQTVAISARSTFFPPGAFYFSELCNYKWSVGEPVGGWPGYLIADDYVEITGVPNSDLGGHTFEAWNASGLINAHTFPSGTFLGPNGTAIIAIGQPSSSVPSPANFYYHADVSHTHGSGDNTGRLLRDQNGNIVDAAAYGNFTFPVASGVTPADWSNPNTASASTTSGMRLIGPDNNTGSNWVVSSSTYPQDPNTVNAGTIVPTPAILTGFTWSHNGVVIANNVIDTVVGPWITSGTYQYIASYVTPCGTLTDTVTIMVNIQDLILSGDTTICAGDTAYVSIEFPGTGPWSLIFTDGVLTDTLTGIPVSPFVVPVSPAQTITITAIGFADATNVYTASNKSVTITVQPLPGVTLPAFNPFCIYDAAQTLSGGQPLGGIYSGIGVNSGIFDPAIAGVGAHLITYTYMDLLGCVGSNDAVINVHPAPVPSITGALDTICDQQSVLLDAGSGFATYLWSDASTAQTLTVTGSSIGVGNSATFSVTVTNTFGCEGEDLVTIHVIDCSGINDLMAPASMLLWPNPSNGLFTVKIDGLNGAARLVVLKATGEQVSSQKVQISGELTHEFNLGHLAAGMYYLQLVNDRGTVAAKVMIQ
jgi:hypothetical protein